MIFDILSIFLHSNLLFCRKLSDEHWLLDFCSFIASEDTDSEVKTKLVDMLQSSMSDSEASMSMMDTTTFEFISVI